MTEYEISSRLNNELKKDLITKYNDIFQELAKTQQKTNNNFLIQYCPFLIEKQNKCIARVWNDGYGGQCSRNICHRNLCKTHLKQLETKGCLSLNNIYEPKPNFSGFKPSSI